jgi:4-hydroxy-3-polyprenylbenzoate decarboxylase
MDQVIWAMSTRCNPAADIDILRNTWSTYLDPTKNPPEERPYGSKTLINACKEHKYLKVFSKRTRLTNDTYDKVEARWAKYGLPFEIPKIDLFEEDVKNRRNGSLGAEIAEETFSDQSGTAIGSNFIPAERGVDGQWRE